MTDKRILKKIPGVFSIAKFSQPVWQRIAESKTRNVFVANTVDEFSVIAGSGFDFSNAAEINSGWRGFKVDGPLDFGIVGLLADVTRILANANISVVAISTFDTDFFFVQRDNFESATAALSTKGYAITE